MSAILNAFMKCGRWIAKHWAISLAAALVAAVGILSVVFFGMYGDQKELVPIYVSVSGLPEGKNMEKRELMVADGATIADIFSLEYPEIYEQFKEPLVDNNNFRTFMEVSPSGGKRFYVKIGNVDTNILTQAYTYPGAHVEISYR